MARKRGSPTILTNVEGEWIKKKSFLDMEGEKVHQIGSFV